jgi:hypothetical protein
MPSFQIFGCAGLLVKGFEMCFHPSLPIKDEAWCQFFAMFSKKFIALQITPFDCLGREKMLFYLSAH